MTKQSPLRNVRTIFAREFKSYFDAPVAYVFLVAFLVLVGFLTFGVAMFYERRQADLTPFFFWHPWVYLLLVPAATMGSWADERRNGTLELLLTLPVTLGEAIVGKFLAAWAFIATGLALTLPIAFTAAWLGNLDWGAAFCGYLGSLLLAGAAAAIGVFASSLSRSGVIGFVVALAITFAMLLIGFDPFTSALANWGVPGALVDGVAACSLFHHFEALRRGVVDLGDVGYYAAVIAVALTAAKVAVDSNRKSASLLGLALVTAIAGAADLILANLPLRADFTAEKLYTLSDGSKAVLGQLDKDVTVKYYFSASSDQMPASLKSYAQQVKNLLAEYELAGKGRLVLEAYDPKPDSDAEEWAQRYGVEQQAVTPLGAGVYFGLVAVCGDHEETLPRLSPRTESTLEYDLTRLVTRVAWPERPVVGLMTSVPGVVAPPMNPMMGRQGPQGWAAINELKKDYDVRVVEPTAEEIPAEVKTLVLLHARDLSDKTLWAIDQFVLRGGRLVACVDPFNVKEMLASRERQNPMMGGAGGEGPSTLGKLFEAWGIGFDSNRVVADLTAATRLNMGNGRGEENPAFLSLKQGHMSKDDLLVGRLTQVMFPFAGAFAFTAKDGLKFEPLITTSADNSCFVSGHAVRFGLQAMKNELVADKDGRVVAARLTGDFKTAFPKGPDGTNDVSKALQQGKGAVLLFGDADFLADDFCVQVINTPFGQMVQPMNDNLALFANVIEQFAGRSELIGVRSRGVSNRPFEKVDKLEAAALKKWQAKESELQGALQETQQRLSALQRQKSGNDRLILSKEQQDEIVQFRKKQADVRRQLKNVRKELTADIDSLGLRLKVLNVIGVSLLVVAFGLFRGWKRRRH